MKRNTFLITVIALFMIFVVADAHSGRTDSKGGHYDRSTGTYHYHSGEYANRPSSASHSTAQTTPKPIYKASPSATKENDNIDIPKPIIAFLSVTFCLVVIRVGYMCRVSAKKKWVENICDIFVIAPASMFMLFFLIHHTWLTILTLITEIYLLIKIERLYDSLYYYLKYGFFRPDLDEVFSHIDKLLTQVTIEKEKLKQIKEINDKLQREINSITIPVLNLPHCFTCENNKLMPAEAAIETNFVFYIAPSYGKRLHHIQGCCNANLGISLFEHPNITRQYSLCGLCNTRESINNFDLFKESLKTVNDITQIKNTKFTLSNSIVCNKEKIIEQERIISDLSETLQNHYKYIEKNQALLTKYNLIFNNQDVSIDMYLRKSRSDPDDENIEDF